MSGATFGEGGRLLVRGRGGEKVNEDGGWLNGGRSGRDGRSERRERRQKGYLS